MSRISLPSNIVLELEVVPFTKQLQELNDFIQNWWEETIFEFFDFERFLVFKKWLNFDLVELV